MNNPTGKRTPTVLILEDRYALRDTMVNLGDRAYHVGLHALITDRLGYKITMGRVKALPWITSRHARRVKTIDDARRFLESHVAKALARADRSKRLEGLFAGWILDNPLTRSRMFRSVDDAVRRRFARGLIETATPFLLRRHYSAELIDAIQQADLIIFNGGAFVADHLDRYLPMVLLELYLASKLGKPTMVVNHTVSISKPSNRALVECVYARLQGLIVREPRSRDVLRDMGIPEEKIVLSCDAAFGLKPALERQYPQLSETRKETGVVGLCVRGDRPVPARFWADVAKMLEEDFGRRVVFFFTSEFQDRAAFDQIAALHPAQTLDRFYDYRELISTIGSYDLVITDRYHGTIFAMLSGTPVVAVDSNTFKTRGLMDLTDYPLEVLANDEDLSRMRAHVETALARREELAKSIRAAADQLAEFAATSIEALRLREPASLQ